MTPEEKIQYVIEQIRDRAAISPRGPIYFPLYETRESELGRALVTITEQGLILRKLESEGRVKNVEFTDDGRGVWLEVVALDESPDIFQEEDFPEHIRIPEQFTVSIRDREVWVNDSLLSKPFASGKNLEFFEFIFSHPDTQLARGEMLAHAQRASEGKRFSKIINELGFSGEILKAFFPRRSKSDLLFRRTVSKKQLVEEGMNLSRLMEELRATHAKKIQSNPK